MTDLAVKDITEENVNNFIEDTHKNNKIVLYMKGTKNMPMCGFSSMVVNILNSFNLDYVTE